jgi:hypothetical protein
MIGIPSGSDDVRVLTTGAFNVINGATNSMFYVRDNGNVGIGTSSPVDRLDVSGVLRVVMPNDPLTGAITAKILSFSPAPFGLVFRGYETGAHSIQSQREANNAQLYPLLLQPLGGNVGIGTSSPSAPLTLQANSSGIGIHIIGRSADGVGFLTFRNNANNVINGEIGISDAQNMLFYTGSSVRLTITSGGIINTTSRLNVNGAGDNSLFSFINNGTTYTLGFSPNASASTSNSLTITTTTTTWIYNGTGTATWTLPTPSGTNQMFWIRNAGTGTLTLNAFSGTSIVNTANSLVSSITIAVGATALIQQDGNIRSYQLQ